MVCGCGGSSSTVDGASVEARDRMPSIEEVDMRFVEAKGCGSGFLIFL